MIEWVVYIILFILAIILYLAILKIKDNTTEIRDLLSTLLEMQKNKNFSIKKDNHNYSDGVDNPLEDMKTKKFVEMLEKTQSEKEFTEVEK